MDLKMILTLFTLTLPLLMADDGSQNTSIVAETPTEPNLTNTSRIGSITRPLPISSSAPCTNQPPARSLGLLSVNWTDVCGGEVVIFFRHSRSLHVCYSEDLDQTLLSLLCESRKGCEGLRSKAEGRKRQRGFNLAMENETDCKKLTLQCKALTDEQAQLHAYKVVVALLCCVLIILFLIRFTRPTVKALQNRLSDRRQTRWVGPTQSHSVSYHQRKAAVQNPDREKRLSYPALERLTVSDSREPSSNRNSGYNM